MKHGGALVYNNDERVLHILVVLLFLCFSLFMVFLPKILFDAHSCNGVTGGGVNGEWWVGKVAGL